MQQVALQIRTQLAILKEKKRSRSCLHLQYPTGFLIHAYAAGPVYIYILQVRFINAYATGLILHMLTIQAPFKRTRLLAECTLHTSTHIRRCCEYTHAAVPFTYAHSALFTHAQTVMFIHSHCTHANPNVALQSVDLLAFRLCCVVFMPS